MSASADKQPKECRPADGATRAPKNKRAQNRRRYTVSDSRPPHRNSAGSPPADPVSFPPPSGHANKRFSQRSLTALHPQPAPTAHQASRGPRGPSPGHNGPSASSARRSQSGGSRRNRRRSSLAVDVGISDLLLTTATAQQQPPAVHGSNSHYWAPGAALPSKPTTAGLHHRTPNGEAKLAHTRYAGASFQNSPEPSALPFPMPLLQDDSLEGFRPPAGFSPDRPTGVIQAFFGDRFVPPPTVLGASTAPQGPSAAAVPELPANSNQAGLARGASTSQDHLRAKSRQLLSLLNGSQSAQPGSTATVRGSQALAGASPTRNQSTPANATLGGHGSPVPAKVAPASGSSDGAHQRSPDPVANLSALFSKLVASSHAQQHSNQPEPGLQPLTNTVMPSQPSTPSVPQSTSSSLHNGPRAVPGSSQDSDVFEAPSRSPHVKVVSAPGIEVGGKRLGKKRTMNRSKSQPNIFEDFQQANRMATAGRDPKPPKASQRSPLGKSASNHAADHAATTSPHTGKGTTGKKPRGRNAKPTHAKGSKAANPDGSAKPNAGFAPKQILKNPNRVHPSAKPAQQPATASAGKTQSTFRAFRSPVTETPLSMIGSPMLLSEVEAHRV
ncbi:hypothetical protein H4R35_005621 [Dimargaris xerosporica]|nr:hypothetical protein H4R35_005621 [Dimargaris xerosporica]